MSKLSHEHPTITQMKQNFSYWKKAADKQFQEMSKFEQSLVAEELETWKKEIAIQICEF